jgi:hypothetical protein
MSELKTLESIKALESIKTLKTPQNPGFRVSLS